MNDQGPLDLLPLWALLGLTIAGLPERSSGAPHGHPRRRDTMQAEVLDDFEDLSARVLVVRTEEELQIAREIPATVRGAGAARPAPPG